MNDTQRRRLPLACKIIYAVLGISACLYLGFVLNTAFADFFNRTVSAFGRRLLGYLTAWIPFSLAECLILCLPVLLVVLLIIAYRFYCDSWKNTLTYIGILFSGVSVILILFVWNFAAGYYVPSLDEKLEMPHKEITASDLTETASWLAEEVNALKKEITFLPSGASMMPMSYREMNQNLMQAYRKAVEKYDFLDHFSTSVKPVMLSVPMSYTHITGVYTFFTGEANINVNFPDYTIPYTAAHELAHQRGIARENEANFVAFLVCMESDDPYIRYSAVLNLYEYVAIALGRADIDAYYEVRGTLSNEILEEQAAYSRFFDQYRDNIAADISQATNDAYLKGQGSSAGTASYGLVVDLAVAYYQNTVKGTEGKAS